MSHHFVCDKCGGPAYWDLFAGVPSIRLHASVPKDPIVVYDQTFDLCRSCFEKVQELIKPTHFYGERKDGKDDV